MRDIDRSGCPAPVHGKYWMIAKYRCRCFDARVDQSNYRTARYRGTRRIIDATAARRITQGLACHGYTADEIAAESGVSVRTVYALQSGENTTITSRKDEALRDLAQRVKVDQPRTGYTASRAKSAARRNGWVPLTAWDDDTLDDPNAEPDLGDDGSTVVDPVVIERALGGERMKLTRLERHHAVHVGLARQLSRLEVSRRLRISWTELARLEALPLPDDRGDVAA